MKKSQLLYKLDSKFIATKPVLPKHNSKLMIVNRVDNHISHKYFHELPSILSKNDVLVFNKTKVTKSNIIGRKKSGGKVDLLLVKKNSDKPFIYKVLGKNIPDLKEKIFFNDGLIAIVEKKTKDEILIRFNKNHNWINNYMGKYGNMPIPPYIRQKRRSESDSKAFSDEKMYQTSFAKIPGSIAAPTAGLHFTNKLLSDLKNSGIETCFLTLHIGIGTFEPIQEADLLNHKMHSEKFSLTPHVAQYLNERKREGKRIIAVGTTTVRVLETCSKLFNANKKMQTSDYNTESPATQITRDEICMLTPQSGETDIFIYPPYKFKFINGLITNFHLPGSTLLALVSAFVSKPNTDQEFIKFNSSLIGRAYSEAKRNNYRFYSYGDGMMIV